MVSCPRSGGRHPVFARAYAWLSRRMEPVVAEHRRDLLAGLSGRVVEVGAGNGLNFAHYPPDVTQVVAVEPEPYLRRIAMQNAARAIVPIEVVDGLADQLPLPDGSVDAAVASLVLCSVPDPAAAVAEIRRVLRAGGELRFYEHVRSSDPRSARVQRALDATVWPGLAGGCHLGRDPVARMRTAGYDIERLDRPTIPAPKPIAALYPHVLGVARRPESG